MDAQKIEYFTKFYELDDTIYIFISNKGCYTVYARVGCTCTNTSKGCWKLSKFSQQGVGKLNDDITKAYSKSTKHRSEEP